MWCDECGKAVGDDAHKFAGWGFFVKYHPACCPGEVDGDRCDEDHPEGWKSEADKAREEQVKSTSAGANDERG